MTNRPWRRLAALALCLAAWPLITVPAASGDSPPDLERLLARARRVQAEDLAAWGRTSFQRKVTRDKLDTAGKVTAREVLYFKVKPSDGGGFEETLFRIDDRQPTPKEVRKHARAQRFTQRYEVAVSGEGPNYEEDQFSLAGLLQRDGYVYRGVESKDGHTCHLLTFDAQPDPPGANVEERMWHATAGRVWLAKKALNIVRAETWTVRTVKAYGLARVRGVRITIRGDRFGDFWLPSAIEVRSDLTIAGVAIYKRNRFEYSAFQLVR